MPGLFILLALRLSERSLSISETFNAATGCRRLGNGSIALHRRSGRQCQGYALIGTMVCILSSRLQSSGRTPSLLPATRKGASMNLPRAGWRKSRRSLENGCVEVAFVENRIAVRDSKNRQAPVLMFTLIEWEAFTRGIRNGGFDLPRLSL